GLSGAHFRTSRGGRAHIGRANAHRVKSARVGMSRNKIAHVSDTHTRALGAAGGGAGGTEDGAVGPDQFFGPTFSAISWPSRSGLTDITSRSGDTEIYLSGMPYSGPVPTMPTAQPIMTFTVDTHTVARHEGTLCVMAPQKLQARSQTELIWHRPAAVSHRA